ncbi:DNA polymerase iota [Magnaporthiopsis poae ATCC 64411]|uniref:DNA polymerase iota n=1 Tax=Magnaporthiopsis poae (strain ATCC 64411 / 73-15) TaxID=644358 RepID=A0A0C4EDQ6_MAGP6|nr:DNA polymerase iota [Magnaporthiopsis poae ATCC 64411]
MLPNPQAAMGVNQDKTAPELKRTILHFDYDCFYAQVIENKHPALKSRPLGIKQKSILATCNYAARARGVKKLGLISEAKKVCPDLVVVNGEDLTPFRDVSKALYRVLRSSCGLNPKAERLGLDEVFLDVTDIVDYNLQLLNPHDLARSFFCLSETDPELGFAFDATTFAGCVAVAPRDNSALADDATTVLSRFALEQGPSTANRCYQRLLLASHLAFYLRQRIEEQGYTCACGISTNKALSKLAGGLNKPRNQTTLVALSQEDLSSFLDPYRLRSVPGIGGRMVNVLESHALRSRGAAAGNAKKESGDNGNGEEQPLTVGQLRTHPGVGPELLENLLRPLGMEKGIGERTWALLHGRDPSEVKAASDIPTQISIEDTYASAGLNTTAQVRRELTKISASLITRMRADLLAQDIAGSGGGVGAAHHKAVIDTAAAQKWIAVPRTLRLTTRPRHGSGSGGLSESSREYNYNHGRVSRSQPIPGFLLSLAQSVDQLAQRLAEEILMPMFHRLATPRPGSSGGGGGGYDVGLLNVCVANVTMTAGDGAGSSGRDIADMFRRRDEFRREFTVYDDASEEAQEQQQQQQRQQEPPTSISTDGSTMLLDGDANAHEDELLETSVLGDVEDDLFEGGDEMDPWDGHDAQRCRTCGHAIPTFALEAHYRYHLLEDR